MTIELYFRNGTHETLEVMSVSVDRVTMCLSFGDSERWITLDTLQSYYIYRV